MSWKLRLLVFAAVLTSTLATVSATVRSAELTSEQVTFFESKIRPVLITECYGCHSNQSGNVRGGLRLDTQALTHIGGSSGPAIVPGDLEESLLFNAISHEDWQMPPRRKLSTKIIEDFRQWIQMGAPDPRVNEISEIRSSISDEDIELAKQNFWAYQAPIDHDLPAIESENWPINDIDYFVKAKLEAADIVPAKDDEASSVLRRLCFDIAGLPPTPKQIDYFTKRWQEDSDAAVQYVVDRMLEKDQYGERWGRHWLDVARYAESTGREVNVTYPHAWRYRDYVIDSFNDDKPFDQFTQEQLAGDLLPANSDSEWAEHLVATSFLAIGAKNVNEQNRIQFAMDQMDEQIDATTRVFLGMSVSCARCHDHKFDAIPQADYYALAGVFSNMTTYFGNPPSEYGPFYVAQRKQNSSLMILPVEDPNPFDKRYTPSELTALRDEITTTMQEMTATRRRSRPASGNVDVSSIQQRLRTQNKLSDLSDKLAIVDANGNPRSYCMGVQEKNPPKNARLLVRGEIDQAAQEVSRGFPQVLCSTPIEIPSRKSGRLDLARWIGSDQNTLTARVMVNRIWQQLIGKGLVTSTDNFGVTGTRPSHPELLDHLAIKFVESGWSVKSMVRYITTSRVYRMQTTFQQTAHEADSENSLLWRANPRRLEAEQIRDAILWASGELDLKRPRGSEVAKAGFTRIRNGVLGDPRETLKQALAQANQARSRDQRASYANGRGFFNQRSSMGRRDGGMSGGQQRMGELIAAATDKMTNRLDMNEAKFRSVYLPIVRDEIPRSLEVFDFADANATIGKRESSSTPNQALFMMNNPFVIQQAIAFAERLKAHSLRPKDQVEHAFLLAYGRMPSSEERSASSQFLREYYALGGSANLKPIEAFCQSLFASSEFRFID